MARKEGKLLFLGESIGKCLCRVEENPVHSLPLISLKSAKWYVHSSAGRNLNQQQIKASAGISSRALRDNVVYDFFLISGDFQSLWCSLTSRGIILIPFYICAQHFTCMFMTLSLSILFLCLCLWCRSGAPLSAQSLLLTLVSGLTNNSTQGPY